MLPFYNMTAKEHYTRHLGNIYAWMCGDFTEKCDEQERFFADNNILPVANKVAIDLGCGHGLQSVALAQLGFSVFAVDFNKQLLSELDGQKKALSIQTVESDLLEYLQNTKQPAELIVSMGDTLTHLESIAMVEKLISEIAGHLIPKGKVVLSFRDLTGELLGMERFIPVKSDDNRILTCFLEFFDDHVRVHDILHEEENGSWIQSVSSYAKLRLNEERVTALLQKNDLKRISVAIINRMIYLIGEKI